MNKGGDFLKIKYMLDVKVLFFFKFAKNEQP